LFRIVLVFVWTGMHAYVFGRASTLPVVARRVSRPILAFAGFFLWSTLFLYRALPSSPVTIALETLALNWLGVLFLLASCLLAADLLTLFGLIFPRRAAAIRGPGPSPGGEAMSNQMKFMCWGLAQSFGQGGVFVPHGPGAFVDHVLERGAGEVAGVEIKAAATVMAADFRGLKKLKEAAGDRFAADLVLYDGERFAGFGEKRYAVTFRALWETT